MSRIAREISIADTKIGGGEFTVIAGPCSIESAEQLETTALSVKDSGASLLRGGIFKMRTQPDSFQGLGKDAFEIVRDAKSKSGLPFISEVVDPRHISDLIDLVDAFQVGSRNMHNYALLKELGKTNKPVMIKRGLPPFSIYSVDFIR